MSNQEKQSGILIVDDQPEALSLLKLALKDNGYKIFSASTGNEAIDEASKNSPDLVLLDLTMPKQDGLEVCRALKSDPKTEDIFVIFLSSISDTRVKTEGLSLGAIDFIQKPFNPTELRARVQAHLKIKKRLDVLRQQHHELCEKIEQYSQVDRDFIDQECIESESKIIHFKSHVNLVQGVVNQLFVGIRSRLSKKVRTDLTLGVHEMILNAVEHGNLGITSSEKCEALDNQTFNTLLNERQADSRLSERLVRIQYTFDGEKVSYQITDEGNGFVWSTFMERDEPEDLLASNGRGILISRYIFDRITYNESGNEVLLEKVIEGVEG